MKLFAWTLHFERELTDIPEIDYDVIRIDAHTLYVMWGIEDEENIHSEDALLKLLEASLWKTKEAYITLEWEKRVEILMDDYEDGSYEWVTFEWPYVDMDDLIERFAESGEVLCVREIGISEIYNTQIVRVDFLY